MPKTIIFCADGTWNGPGSDDETESVREWTNVYKLFLTLEGENRSTALKLKNEQECVLDGVQVAKYIHGVGDSDNFFVKYLEGATGMGVISRILRGYTFLSRHYSPGDHIVIVGFSRGAYTARALGGLIAAKGLIDRSKTKLTEENKDDAYRMAAAVWREYRTANTKGKRGLVSALADTLSDLPGFFTQTKVPPLVTAPIKAVAVWDTVGAMGIPVYNEQNYPIDLFQFTNTVLSDKVEHGLHFVAADERRASFTPTLWDARKGIKQVVYPGAHADVGGGYVVKESGLSDGALADMITELAALGVRFKATKDYPFHPDATAPAHEPWTDPPFDAMTEAPREGLKGLDHSASFAARLKASVCSAPGKKPKAYAPTNILS